MATSVALSSNLNFNDLTFTNNCRAVANFTGLYFWGSRQNFIRTYDALYYYVLASLPSGANPPSKNQVMTWFYQIYNTNQVLSEMYQAS